MCSTKDVNVHDERGHCALCLTRFAARGLKDASESCTCVLCDAFICAQYAATLRQSST